MDKRLSQAILASVYLPLLLFSDPGLSQTRWFKYTGNPTLDVGLKGTWDEQFIHINRVIKHDSMYQMWYSGGWTYVRTGYATSRDGITWEKYGRNPVLDVTPGGWDSKVAHRGYVIFTGSGYKMWYNGDSLSTYHIGYASSPDGIHWTKFPRPVLSPGPPGSWDGDHVGWCSIIGSDTSGTFQMWYGAQPGWKIGYATGSSETTWTKYGDPVLWDDKVIYQPRVLLTGDRYEIWYAVGWQPASLAYAVSNDGVHWSKSPENPVLLPGPPTTWDDEGIVIGDVRRERDLYRMWYNGNNGSVWRGGYAISPVGITVDIKPSSEYLVPRKGVVRFRLRANDPEGLSFYASIKTPGLFTENPQGGIGLTALREVARLELLDDGQHDDSLAHDGIFGNTWVPRDENLHFADLELRLRGSENQTYEMQRATVFTTIGPVKIDSVIFLGDKSAHPGDTVEVRLLLRNDGASTPARSIKASLSSTDASIMGIVESSPMYGSILPGKCAGTVGNYRVIINPYSLIESRATIHALISSWGIPLWHDSFTIRIVPPWWRSIWAYVIYALLLVSVVSGAFRYVGVRKFRRKVEQLELVQHERARISQDMHDELGGTLTEISILSELARKRPQEAADYLQQMSDRAAKAIDSMGGIIWAMNPKNDSLDNLIGHIRRDVTKSLGLTNIHCTFTAPDSIPPDPISSETRRNIFLVTKEAIHNAVKHSGAACVSVTVGVTLHGMEIVVADDGKGFDMTAGNSEGNGLRNMRKRMTDIGGNLRIESQPDRGTRVELHMRL